QFYDHEVVDPVQFPTRDEVLQCIPTANAPSPVNDPTLSGSWILAANLHGYSLTGDQEYADKARMIFQGLVRLAGLARTSGYIPRGSVPGHDVVYPNSSADQYTGFFYAMWRYWQSAIAKDQEKALAAGFILDAAKLIESSGHDVPCDDLLPSFYGDMSNIDEVCRCCRLLQTYRTAFIMTGDEHWERLYREKLEENDRKRLKRYHNLKEHPPELPVANWGMWQNQAAFRMLYESESEPDIKEAYRNILDEEARMALPRLKGWEACFDEKETLVYPDRWRAFWPHFMAENPNHDRRRTTRLYHHHTFNRFIRDNEQRIKIPKEMLERGVVAKGVPGYHLQILACAMYAEDRAIQEEAMKEGLPMLTTADLTRPGHCPALKCFEIAYWRAVEAGLMPQQ
ncbi:MAG: hypothetical protein QF886_23500, partial [Planctomycetota bacterium]|nr:hypothetical protein [Planctomycetota bacterium]